jgi:hypothetical protein
VVHCDGGGQWLALIQRMDPGVIKDLHS